MRRLALILALGTVLATMAPAAAAPGHLDTTFGGNGMVAIGSSTGSDVASDGNKTVAVGSSGGAFQIVRLTASGSQDPMFGGDGIVGIDLGGVDKGYGLVLDDFGGVVVAGSSGQGGDVDTAVARVLSDGTPTAAFAGDGARTFDFAPGNTDRAAAVGLTPGGKIVVGGTAVIGGRQRFMVARILKDGTRDDRFGGGDGVVTTKIGGGAWINDLLVLGDGRLLAVGTAKIAGYRTDWALARYNPNGTLDTSFGGDGKVTSADAEPESAEGVAQTAEGKYVVVGSSGHSMYIRRYLANGALDEPFGVNGHIRISVYLNAVALDISIAGSGKALIVGTASSSQTDVAVARLTATGHLDDSFAGDGLVLTDMGGGLEIARACAITGSGKLVVAGSTDGLDPVPFRRRVGGSMLFLRYLLS